MVETSAPTANAAPEEDLFANVHGPLDQQQQQPQQEEDLFANVHGPLDQQQAPAAQQQQPQQEEDLFANVHGPLDQPQQQPPASATPAPPTDAMAGEDNPIMSYDPTTAIGVGMMQGIYATKDFFATGGGLWGTAPGEAQRSGPRQALDATAAKEVANDGLAASFAQGLGATAVGLLGVGKLTTLKALGTAGVAAGDTLGLTAAFQPHAENFANLAQRIPSLNGPVTQFFASNPGDSDAAGYAKNALVSLGFGAATVGLFTGTMGALKALRGGDQAAIEAAHSELEAALQDHVASLKQNAGGEGWASQATSPTDATGEPSPASPASASSPSLSGTGPDTSAPSLPSPDASLSPPSSSTSLSGGKTPSASTENGSLVSAADARVVSNPTEGAAQPGTGALSPTAKPFQIDEETLGRILDSASADQAALIKYGSWDNAVANGHVFGAGEDKIPWQLMGQAGTGQAETSLDAFTARVRDAAEAQSDAMKGGAAQTDAMNARAVNQRVALWNQDPAMLTGMLQAAGESAGSLRANMMASFTVAQRAMQDAWTMASRVRAGDFSEWGGSQEAAMAALKEQTQVAATAFGAANAILSNSARALRGARGEFALSPIQIANMQALDGRALAEFLASTQGDPRALAKALEPTMLQRLVDGGQFFMVNNLISSPLTHVVIAASNTWQALARPAMRVAGSVALDAPAAVRATLAGSKPAWATYNAVGREAQAAYGYMATSIPDAFRAAVQAFKAGDSIISPHGLLSPTGGGGRELSAGQEAILGQYGLSAAKGAGSPASSSIGQQIAQMQFGPWDNVGDILRNVLTAGLKTGAFPSRAVGFQDEFVKQLVYRAKVSANALIDGSARGLAGDDLTRFVQGKLFSAFDDFGRATDTAALNEAKTATYQNDLNATGNGGYATTGAMLQRASADYPPLKIVMPFVRTPVNMFRQGVQLTPGLNLFQKEFRDAIMGNAAGGAEAQAQAVGQMGMGALIMGTVGTMAYQGLVTGDAPSDPKLAAEAMADGWRPNSIVIPHADGSKTYIPFDRYDPVMMPFAMAANIVAVLKQPEIADQNKAARMMQALALALYKQITNKLYLQNLANTIEAVQAPDRNMSRIAGGLAANFVPYSSALHLINADPVTREADTFISAALAKVPGFSRDFPARYDWAGDPVTVHKGLWLDTPASQADAEMQRLALQQGASVGAPSPKARGGADLRDITLAGNKDPEAAGRTAYDRFQELAGHPERMPGAPPNVVPLRDAVSRLIATDRYQQMPDGAPDEAGTKIAVLMDLVRGYRKAALGFVGGDNNVRSAEYAETVRVAKANGYAMPNMPTATNQTDGFLNKLGKAFGLSGLHAPSPQGAPTLGTPQQSQQQQD